MLDELIATAGVQETHRPGGPIGVMAIHGGLEEGTDGIAVALADQTGAALYTVIQPDNLRWHVPSILYDPAQSGALAAFVGSVHAAVSIHGYGEPGLEATALLGGNNRIFAQKIAAEMAARSIAAVADLAAIPKRLRGIHRRNPVNLPPEAGVQIELPMSLREGRNLALVTEAVKVAIDRFMVELPGPAAAR